MNDLLNLNCRTSCKSDKKIYVIIGNWSIFAVNCVNKIAMRGGKGNK